MAYVRDSSPVFDGKSSLKFNTKSSDVSKLIKSNAIYDRFENSWYNKFSRFGIIDPYNALTTTKEYIFFTKPDLCLMNDDGSISNVLSFSPFFVDAISRYNPIAKQLQSSISKGDPPFMTVLSNSITSSLDLPGLSSDMVEGPSNVVGTKISYRGTSLKSDESHDFNIEFEDTKYLDVYMLFKMYDEYEKLKWGGFLDFTKASSSRWTNYILDKVLHDQISIYKFVVGEDGYRIVYYARITGCSPTSVPRDAFSDMNNNEPQKLTVGWRGHFVRDMDPTIIAQFNSLVKSKVQSSTRDLPLYNTNIHAMEGDWAVTPYIDTRIVNDSKHGSHREYYLRWRA